MKSFKSISRSASRIFLQNDLLGRHRANAANGQGLDRLLDVLALLHIGHAIACVHQELFGIGVLQTGRIGHHQPTTEGLVFTRVPVDGHPNVDLSLIEFLGGLGQGQFHGSKHDVTLDILFA